MWISGLVFGSGSSACVHIHESGEAASHTRGSCAVVQPQSCSLLSCSSRQQVAASAWTDHALCPSNQRVGEDLGENNFSRDMNTIKSLSFPDIRKTEMEHQTTRRGEEQTVCSHHEDISQKLSGSKW